MKAMSPRSPLRSKEDAEAIFASHKSRDQLLVENTQLKRELRNLHDEMEQQELFYLREIRRLQLLCTRQIHFALLPQRGSGGAPKVASSARPSEEDQKNFLRGEVDAPPGVVEQATAKNGNVFAFSPDDRVFQNELHPVRPGGKASEEDFRSVASASKASSWQSVVVPGEPPAAQAGSAPTDEECRNARHSCISDANMFASEMQEWRALRHTFIAGHELLVETRDPVNTARPRVVVGQLLRDGEKSASYRSSPQEEKENDYDINEEDEYYEKNFAVFSPAEEVLQRATERLAASKQLKTAKEISAEVKNLGIPEDDRSRETEFSPSPRAGKTQFAVSGEGPAKNSNEDTEEVENQATSQEKQEINAAKSEPSRGAAVAPNPKPNRLLAAASTAMAKNRSPPAERDSDNPKSFRAVANSMKALARMKKQGGVTAVNGPMPVVTRPAAFATNMPRPPAVARFQNTGAKVLDQIRASRTAKAGAAARS